MAEFGQNLALAKAAAISEINAAAGLARQKFITTCPGQEMIYIAKEREALAFLAAPTVDLAAYPLLAAEVGVTAPTPWELAQIWANVAVYWRGLAGQIEGARMRAIAQVEVSREPATVTATVRRFRPL